MNRGTETTSTTSRARSVARAGSGQSSSAQHARARSTAQGRRAPLRVGPSFAGTTPQHAAFGGPVMFSAPHGLEVYRGGGDTGERERLHKREQWTTELALRLSIAVQSAIVRKLLKSDAPAGVTAGDDGKSAPRSVTPPPRPPVAGESTSSKAPQVGRGVCCSFVVWNCKAARPMDRSNLDPNYTQMAQFAQSPWHQALVQFRDFVAVTYPQGTVALHVDLHGKKDRENNFDMDVGIESMDQLVAGKSSDHHLHVQRFRQVVREELSPAIKLCPVKLRRTMEAGVEMHPDLHGFWGMFDGCPVTMTTQAVLLGMTSMQLEVPYTMRGALMGRSEAGQGFFAAMAEALANVFVRLQSDAVRAELAARFKAVDSASERALKDAQSLLADAEQHFSAGTGTAKKQI